MAQEQGAQPSMSQASNDPSSWQRIFGYYTIPGFIQGFAIYLWIQFVDTGEKVPGIMLAVLSFLIIAPMAFYLTQNAKQWKAAAIFSLGLAALVALLNYTVYQTYPFEERNNEYAFAMMFFSNLVICYIAAPFFRTVIERQQRPNHYPSLFEFAWNLPIIIITAGLFTLVVMGILGLWAVLFEAIGIDFFTKLFFTSFDGFFLLTITYAAGATAIGIVRASERILLALRSILFALLKILSPVVTLATTLFVLATLVQGVDNIWDDLSITTLILCTISLAIVLTNAVIGDEGVPQNPILRWSVRLQGIVLAALAGFMLYGIFIRLAVYGLTVHRFYLLILVLFAAAYAGATFLGALFMGKGFGLVRQANIVLAGLLFITAIWVQTPFANAQKMAINSQIKRIIANADNIEQTDLAYMQYKLGKKGKDALADLLAKSDNDHLKQEIEKIQDSTSYYSATNNDSDIDEGKIATLIENNDIELIGVETLPEGYIAKLANNAYKWRDCNKDQSYCAIAPLDYYAEKDGYLLFNLRYRVDVYLLYHDDGLWKEENFRFLRDENFEEEEVIKLIKQGAFHVEPVEVRGITLGAQRFMPSHIEDRHLIKQNSKREEKAAENEADNE